MKQKTGLACFIILICIASVDTPAQFIVDSLSNRLTQKNLPPEERVTVGKERGGIESA